MNRVKEQQHDNENASSQLRFSIKKLLSLFGDNMKLETLVLKQFNLSEKCFQSKNK